MALPPVAKTPVLLMRFTPKASHEVIAAAIQALTEGGIIIVDSEGLHDENGKLIVGGSSDHGNNNNGKGSPVVVLGLTTTQGLLEHEAELLRISKPCGTSHRHIPTIMEPFSSGSAREDFINIKHVNDDDYDDEGLFNSAERALLVECNYLTIRSSIKALIAAIPAPTSMLSEEDKHLPSKIVHKLRHSAVGNKVQAFAEDNEYETPTSTLFQVLRQNEYVDVAPVHIPRIKKRILKENYAIMTAPPLQAIRDYYGEGVAFYFAWMNFMTWWFAFPGMLGLVVYVLRVYRGHTIDDCDLTPFVGLATFCWAVLCTRYWERYEAELAYKWGTFAVTEGDTLRLGKRIGFKGKMRSSPITGAKERYYPAYKRQLKCVVSAIITIFILAGACVVMVISMNVQGYVSRADRELWGERDHPLYFPFFSQLAEEGGIFDANSSWKIYGPVILRAIVVVNMNSQYSHLAEMLTEWENHETVLGHQNSVILKRVLFEAFDASVVLFYLAFFERDIYLLRSELVGAFNVDALRRVFTECVLPYICKCFKKEKDPVGMSKKNDDLTKDATGYLASEAELEQYDTFDDYIEMLIQFGYVTLFASAYPLAAFLAMGANMIEIRSDLWKITHLCRRMSPVRANGIGMWKLSLKAIAWLAAGSNLLIFAFTSSQMQQWFPEFYVTDEITGRTSPGASSSNEILLIVLIIEQFLVVIAGLVNNSVPTIPQSVCIDIQRRNWFHEHLASKRRHRTATRTSTGITALSHTIKQLDRKPASRQASSVN
ncbi:hypothetical protein ACHAXR_013200 [Thalassiosira sp. AJA248-18]